MRGSLDSESSDTWSWDSVTPLVSDSDEGPRNTAEWQDALDGLPNDERWDSPLYQAPEVYPGVRRREFVVLRLGEAIFTVLDGSCGNDFARKRAKEVYRAVEVFISQMPADFMDGGEIPDEEEYLTSHLVEIFASYSLDFQEFAQEYKEISESVRVWLVGIREAFRANAQDIEALNEEVEPSS